MADNGDNGFRTPYRYITLTLLGVGVLLAAFVLAELHILGRAGAQTNGQHEQLGRAIERLVTAVEEQTYLLDQVLPEARRLGLGMPPTLRRRVELGHEYPGDPWQRRRAPLPREREPRLSAPGDGG